MRPFVAALAALLIGGCAVTTERGCYIGLNLFPPSPILVCGIDITKDE